MIIIARLPSKTTASLLNYIHNKKNSVRRTSQRLIEWHSNFYNLYSLLEIKGELWVKQQVFFLSKGLYF